MTGNSAESESETPHSEFSDPYQEPLGGYRAQAVFIMTVFGGTMYFLINQPLSLVGIGTALLQSAVWMVVHSILMVAYLWIRGDLSDE